MIRIFLFLSLSFAIVLAATTVDKKIKKASSKLNSFSANYSTINKKMANNAKEIIKQKQIIKKQNTYLTALKKELLEKESIYKKNGAELLEMKKTQDSLLKVQEDIEYDLFLLISKIVSLSVILEEQHSTNAESMIEYEVLQSMSNQSNKKVKELNNKFYTNSKSIDGLSKKTSDIEKAIDDIDKKRQNLISTQKENKNLLKKLKVAESSYKKKLKNLLKQQDTIKNTLAKLNIIKIDQLKKAKRDAQRKKAFSSKKKVSNENLPKVKKHGSSYQAVKTKKYRGKKTIAPLDSYTITKKYGTYTDPIYGIKVFNESISLKPKQKNAKVKTVFNGKVIYADKTNVLDNIVIIEHSNGLHTIYANLSQISPNIKKGKKVKKGYTIGRVSEELMFEVTQKSYHINPIRLFK